MGSRNPRLFQLLASLTNKRNFIDIIIIGGNVTSCPLEIKFRLKLSFPTCMVAILLTEEVGFKTLSNDSSIYLEMRSKASERMVFIYFFYKKNMVVNWRWDLLLVLGFFKTSKMSKGINSYISIICSCSKYHQFSIHYPYYVNSLYFPFTIHIKFGVYQVWPAIKFDKFFLV